jgi:predicted outer membrane repeat protein
MTALRYPVLISLLICLAAIAADRPKTKAKTEFSADEVMLRMDQIGPLARAVNLGNYAKIIHVGAGEEFPSIVAALDAVKDASAAKRYAILVSAAAYNEVRVAMKPYVDLYGGFARGDWANRDVYANATVIDAQKKGPVILGADHATLDGFVITGGQQNAHGGGIVCNGVSPTIVNNIITANNTLKVSIKEGFGLQMGNEGAGVALLHGSKAEVCNNLICENTTEVGSGAAISARDQVQAKILRNIFCNNTAGTKDDQMFHGKVGSRSSPGGAIACAEASSPQISFNVFVLNSAPLNNDGGAIWVEGNSTPLINYNWFTGNTSGDDGGAIYVMGNVYYDADGKRYQVPPDGPVRIEDNFIAANDSGRGAPGGVRVSRLGRVELRRNRIVANAKGGARGAEGGVITVLENNIIADNGDRREPATPNFRFTGDITASSYDPQHHVTQLTTGTQVTRRRTLEHSEIRRRRAPDGVGQNRRARDKGRGPRSIPRKQASTYAITSSRACVRESGVIAVGMMGDAPVAGTFTVKVPSARKAAKCFCVSLTCPPTQAKCVRAVVGGQ